MPDYNFLNLSSFEFEELSRDLLQKSLNVTLESFTSGKDKGIDLRFAGKSSRDIIIQSKRYSHFNELLGSLKKEALKVTALNPQRYILTTSVGLTPIQKDQIQRLFPGYIKSTADILGKQDINNLLGMFPDIEDQHFKLWLTSSNTLEKILKRKVYNQSRFEEEKVKASINVYVQNESYFKALKILEKKRFVIISGIPGIGKTTLARILVYHFLAKGFEEFIFLSDSIKEGYDTYKENKRQIFFFDDFLGRNFIGKTLNNNEENRILRFVEKINSSPNKILILTTREYILSQAKQRYDILNDHLLELSKCIIDLSHYTKVVRAKIFYNHLFFSNISKRHIENILEKENYMRIIDHENYNPRIIQTITKDDLWRNIKPDHFSKKLIEFLDYPDSVWQHVYENQISKFSQFLLVNLMSAGTPILLEDLQRIMINFSKKFSVKYAISHSELEFKTAIQELENTFIVTFIDEWGQVAVDYQNPSVLDFLVNFFRQFSDIITDVIEAAIYFNQLVEVFSTDDYRKEIGFHGREREYTKILLNDEQKRVFTKKTRKKYHALTSSSLHKVRYSNISTYLWERKWNFGYYKLYKLLIESDFENDSSYREFFVQIFNSLLAPKKLDDLEYEAEYLEYLVEDFSSFFIFDELLLIKSYFSVVTTYIDFYNFRTLENVFPKSFRTFIKEKDYDPDKLSSLAMNFALTLIVSDRALDFWRIDIRNAANKFDFKVSDALKILQKRIDKIKEGGGNNPFDAKEPNILPKEFNADKKIQNMFDGLLSDSNRDNAF